MAAALVVEEEDVVEIDPGEEEEPEELPSDDDEEREEGPELPPALLQLRTARQVLKDAIDKCIWEVYAADEAAEPYDQELLFAMTDEVEAVEDLCGKAIKSLNRRRWIRYYQPDPPGFPEGTLRFDPLLPEEVKKLRDELQEEFNRFSEVKARDGIILFAWREGDETELSRSGELIKMFERGQSTGKEMAPPKQTPSRSPATAPATTSGTQDTSQGPPAPPSPARPGGSRVVKPRPWIDLSTEKPAGPRKEDRFKKKEVSHER